MEIITVRDNSDTQREVFSLPIGTQLRCKKLIRGLDDVGMSGLTVECDEFIKDRVYKVHSNRSFGIYNPSWVLSETGCLDWAETSVFEKV